MWMYGIINLTSANTITLLHTNFKKLFKFEFTCNVTGNRDLIFRGISSILKVVDLEKIHHILVYIVQIIFIKYLSY